MTKKSKSKLKKYIRKIATGLKGLKGLLVLLGIICFLGLLGLFALIVLFYTRSTFRVPKRLSIPVGALPDNAKFSLESFHDRMSVRPIIPTTASNLQIDTTLEKYNSVMSVITNSFPSDQFSILIKDANNANDILTPDFFVNFSEEYPLLVLITNTHKATDAYMRTFASQLSEKFVISDNKTRWSNNIGFLFVGAGMPSNTAICNNIDMYEHNVNVYGWSNTIMTRLMDMVKIC